MLAVAVLLASVVPASAATGLALPRPSGPHRVGRTELHLVDVSRTDPWRGGPRELMVSLHYPALPGPGRDAVPLPGRWPVVVYSPGLDEPRTWCTATAEDLASRGYVVVSIDHTWESPEVEFPDGSVRTMVDPGEPDAFLRTALRRAGRPRR
ncbi:hypothetical protein [Amycolatopsis methanolica]|uniref:Lipase n=1 Tax=Amycolatopsis methanolica 239 TaxID=1068978 RepID=A0A076MMP7_AMYME|nr:hypothetical protein [Amycolatopsis methanolica]AIJ22093.1 hypothetical protein AMETH_2001 [Amycolatopsis methanolica 239]